MAERDMINQSDVEDVFIIGKDRTLEGDVERMNEVIHKKVVPQAQRQFIKIRGASEHNLKHIDIDIPRNEFVVLTGLSGSGKS